MAAHSASSLGKRRRRFEHGDVGAEPPESLRQFEADGAGADDDEMTRTIGEIEHGVAGEVRRVGKAGNRRQRRRRAGGDDEAARRDGEIAGGDGARIQEPRRAVDDVDAETGQALVRLARRHGVGDVAQVRFHRGEIDAEARRVEPEMRGIADDVGALGGRGERRGRHAAAGAGAIAIAFFWAPFSISTTGTPKAAAADAAARPAAPAPMTQMSGLSSA